MNRLGVAGSTAVFVAVSASALPLNVELTYLPSGVFPSESQRARPSADGTVAVSVYADETRTGYQVPGTWTKEVGLALLPNLPATNGIAFNLNDAGDVIGTLYTGSNHLTRPWVWNPHDGYTMLPTLGGVQTAVSDITNDGKIVGWSFPGSGGDRKAVLWETPSQIRNLGTLGGADSYATAVNSAGTVVGYATDAAKIGRPFICRLGGSMTALQELGTDVAGGQADDINESGQIVGYLRLVSPPNSALRARAVAWNSDGVPSVIPIPFFADAKSTFARSINNYGDTLVHIFGTTLRNALIMGDGYFELPDFSSDEATTYFGVNDQLETCGLVSTRIRNQSGEVIGWRYAGFYGQISVPPLADANGDGHVDSTDFNALSANFGMLSGATVAMGDFDQMVRSPRATSTCLQDSSAPRPRC